MDQCREKEPWNVYVHGVIDVYEWKQEPSIKNKKMKETIIAKDHRHWKSAYW